MAKILISGGAGHLGSYLMRRFPLDEILIVDNLCTQRYCSLFNPPPNVKFLQADFEDLDVQFLNAFDAVIHLAAIVDAASSFKNKFEINKVNIDHTRKFIEKVAQSKVKLFIFPSSTSVYGKSKRIMYEGDDNLEPQSPYAEGKLLIENVLNYTDINYIIFRFGTIFGISKGMRFQTAINKFCWQAAFGVPLTIWK